MRDMTKLLTQGDDFGFTRGVTLGIVDSIDHGVLRNTGLFTNMPSTEFAVSFMADRPQVCFGIDFNIVSGRPVLDPSLIPHLVDENGAFIRSGVRVKDQRYQSEQGGKEMFPYEECYREMKAQYERFLALTGRKPGYLHAHSLMHENYMQVIRDLSKETGVPFSLDMQKQYGFVSKETFQSRSVSLKGKIFDPEEQLARTPLQDNLKYAEEFLSAEYITIACHPGYIDDELLGLTTLSLARCKDAAMMMSLQLKDWIETNHVELITYDDLH
jgi:predicted glycoside hydrolase/deacetylase ChbG (UPF0249 family)